MNKSLHTVTLPIADYNAYKDIHDKYYELTKIIKTLPKKNINGMHQIKISELLEIIGKYTDIKDMNIEFVK